MELGTVLSAEMLRGIRHVRNSPAEVPGCFCCTPERAMGKHVLLEKGQKAAMIRIKSKCQ